MLKIPEFEITPRQPFIERITQKIINKTFLIEGEEVEIGKQKGKILAIQKDLLTIQFEKMPKISPGEEIRIDVQKKIIAVVDFEVIRGQDKSIGSVSMESLITSLVNSGQFVVVERSKLKSILRELELGLTGLTDDTRIRRLGKLLQADIILTGSFADMGGVWNVNLRLVNVTFGTILVAIEERTSFADIRPEVFRDSSSNIGDFETEAFGGWLIGHRIYDDGGKKDVSRDTTIGANDTKSSFRMDFTLGNRTTLFLENLKKRDWSLYSGIEFYAKGDVKTVLNFSFQDENLNDPDKRDVWFAQVTLGSTWEEYRIGFNEFGRSLHPNDLKLGGDGVMNLNLIHSLRFGIVPLFNRPGISGTVWIDEVKLY